MVVGSIVEFLGVPTIAKTDDLQFGVVNSDSSGVGPGKTITV